MQFNIYLNGMSGVVENCLVFLNVTGQPSQIALISMQSFFFIHLKGKFVRINVNDIKYALAVAHHVKICADQGTFIPHLSLKQLETFLPVESFSRVNRGTLVALNRIMSFDKDEVVLKDIRFSFSDKYRKELESKITVMLHQERF